MLRRTAPVLTTVAILIPRLAAAGESNTVESSGDGLSILAFAILFVGFAWLAVPHERAKHTK